MQPKATHPQQPNPSKRRATEQQQSNHSNQHSDKPRASFWQGGYAHKKDLGRKTFSLMEGYRWAENLKEAEVWAEKKKADLEAT